MPARSILFGISDSGQKSGELSEGIRRLISGRLDANPGVAAATH